MNYDQERRFIVLDRDGTIIEEREYLSRPEDVTLLDGAASSLRELRQLGFGLVVITNQSGVGRGIFNQNQLGRVHDRLRQLLDQEGVRLDGIYICPHRPEDHCACRKPRLALFHQAAMELGFRPENSIVIGDKDIDIDMGRQAGAMTFLVRTGYGSKFEKTTSADFVVHDLSAAAAIIRRFSQTD